MGGVGDRCSLFSVANCTAENSTVEQCIASKAQSLCHACTDRGQSGKLRTVGKGAVQHSGPVSAVYKSGEDRGTGGEGLTRTRLVQGTVAFPQGEGG